MSTSTTNFGIVLPEGTDTFNPLTFENNAFTRVDEVMKVNQDRGITPAVHSFLEGIHTILRTVATCPTLVFVASADWTATDTIAVDGVTMTLRYADGSLPSSNAFRTNQAVMCYVNGTILTLISCTGDKAVTDKITALEGVVGNAAELPDPEASVVDNVAQLNNKLTVQTGTLASGFLWAKFWNVATLNIEWTVTTLNSWVTIGTLPFAPYYSFYTPIWLNNANTYQGLYIDATGLVQIYASGGTKVYGSVTFVCH